MARKVKPELVATLEAAPPAGAPTPPAQPPSGPQLQALGALVESLDDEQTQELLAGADEVLIRLRRTNPGEVWVRAD